MTADLAASCADLARLLPEAAALLAQPDEDGTTGSGQPSSRPPWNSHAAHALTDAAEGVRRLEASMRRDITGHPGRRRGGSDANTIAALQAIGNLSHAIGEDDQAAAAAIIGRWAQQIRELAAVDESEPWRRMSGVACPYCHFPMLWIQARAGRVACLRGGICLDSDGRPPVGHLDVSRITGDPLVRWQDGLIAP